VPSPKIGFLFEWEVGRKMMEKKPRVHPSFDPERVPQSHTPIMGGSFIPLEAFQTILLHHPFSMSLLAYARAKEEKTLQKCSEV